MPDKTTRGIRYAPHFEQNPEGGDPDPGHQYTAVSLARFLGWTKEVQGRVMPGPAVEIALSALEMVEAGVLDEAGRGVATSGEST